MVALPGDPREVPQHRTGRKPDRDPQCQERCRRQDAGRLRHAKKEVRCAGKESQDKATSAGEMAEADEHRALRYDVGEGLLEIGLVLTSLYFISKKMMFPALGVVSGLAGVVFAITGLMI